MSGPAHLSTRRITRETGTFTRSTAGSQTLERGLQLLRAFRLASSVLTNAELAERTGLPRPTVSRLARSLVDAGFLEYEIASRGYRLGVVILSLAIVLRYDMPVAETARPLIRKIARTHGVNVSLAVADQMDMVYIESVREGRRGMFKRAVPGSRFPMAPTASGRAYLAGLGSAAREAIMVEMAQFHGPSWPALRRGIEQARRDIRHKGYCLALWQPGQAVIAAPLVVPAGGVYALSIGFQCADAQDAQPLALHHAPQLAQLVADVKAAFERF